MPDFPRSEFSRPNPEPSLAEIHRSEDFIEALSSGRPVMPQDHADAALAALLGGWRNETRWPPDSGLISESQAIAALNAGLSEKPAREPRTRRADHGRSRRGLSVVGAAAAAVLCLGGFGAVVSGAGPGDALYGLRTMMFGTPREVRDDQVALAARSELTKVQELISQGDWQQAQAKLVAVSNQVAAVGDEQQKQELLTQFNDLSAKVVERNPEATAPPGIVYTVPPSATELVPAPAPLTDSATTVATTTSAPSAATTTPTSGDAASSTQPAGTSAAPSSSAASSPASPASSAPSSPGSSTPGSSSPVSTSAPASASQSQSASTSAPASAASTTAVTSAPGTSGATSASSTAASSTAASSTAASAPATSVPATSAPGASTSAAAQSPATSSAPAAAAATTTATAASESQAPQSATPTSAAPKTAATTTAESTSQAPMTTEAVTQPTTAQTAATAPTTAAPATTTMVLQPAG